MNDSPVKDSFRAFTLTELLVVIAIVGVLTALILVVIGNMRQRAHDAVCMSNLRQVYVALNLYATEHKRQYPTPLSHGSSPRFIPVRYYINGKDSYGSSQSKALDPYLSDLSVTMCPSIQNNPATKPSELQYWYGSVSPSINPIYGQTERQNSADPYPSLAWCGYPHASLGGKAPHNGGSCMNVLHFDGSVSAVPSSKWRSAAFP